MIPPKVEYRLTTLGLSLSAAFCGVWIWAEEHIKEVETARAVFDDKGKSIQDRPQATADMPAKTVRRRR